MVLGCVLHLSDQGPVLFLSPENRRSPCIPAVQLPAAESDLHLKPTGPGPCSVPDPTVTLYPCGYPVLPLPPYKQPGQQCRPELNETRQWKILLWGGLQQLLLNTRAGEAPGFQVLTAEPQLEGGGCFLLLQSQESRSPHGPMRTPFKNLILNQPWVSRLGSWWRHIPPPSGQARK